MNESKFQFKGFKINRSLLEKRDGDISKRFSFNFEPKGILNTSKRTYNLQLNVLIKDENDVLSVEMSSVANFAFEQEIKKEKLQSLFYVNAPAILFPYVRAYISTLSTLSGFPPIILPTLNLSGLGDELQKNTIEE